MRLHARPGDGELRTVALQRLAQAQDEIGGQERRIAGNGGHEPATRMREPSLESGERPRESRDLVGDHAVAECAVGVEVAVGVDEELVDLRREALDRVRDHRLAAEGLQSLVHPAHAATLAPGEHHAGHLDIQGRSAPRSVAAPACAFTRRCAPVNRR